MKLNEIPFDVINQIISFYSFDTSDDGMSTLCSLQTITKEFYNQTEFNDIIWKNLFENKFLNPSHYSIKDENILEIKNQFINCKQFKYYYAVVNHYLYKLKIKNQLPLTSNYNEREIQKVYLFGCGGAGVSSIIGLFLNGTGFDPTWEDSYRKTIKVDNKHCEVEVFNVLGTDECSALRQQFCRDCNNFIYVCSINDLNSLMCLEEYFYFNFLHKETNHYPCILCVNKVDLPNENHEITNELIDKFLNEMIEKRYLRKKCLIIYTSVKDNININELFETMIRLGRIDYSIDIFEIIKKVLIEKEKIFEEFEKKKKCMVQ
ncbi:hypothetical protein ABK040_013949 [Willaertia magna]